jgi:hypothetical protein
MRRHPEQDIQKALADHLRLSAAPGAYCFHPAAHAEGIDAAIAQLERWGVLLGRVQ